MKRDEEHTLRKVMKNTHWRKCLGRIPGTRKRGTREKEDGTTENKMETCNPTILDKMGLLD